MINGGIIAPFKYDSTWPYEIQKGFRSAVYYLHESQAGRDPIDILREMISRHIKPSQNSYWDRLKRICSKVTHQSVEKTNGEISGKEMNQLVRGVLVLANLLLIDEYGIVLTTFKFKTDDPEVEKILEERSIKTSTTNKDYIYRVYDSLETALQNLGKKTPTLMLEEDAAALSEIPVAFVNSFDFQKKNVRFVIDVGNPKCCTYEFNPVKPVGWTVSGELDLDIWSDDQMSSPEPGAD